MDFTGRHTFHNRSSAGARFPVPQNPPGQELRANTRRKAAALPCAQVTELRWAGREKPVRSPVRRGLSLRCHSHRRAAPRPFPMATTLKGRKGCHPQLPKSRTVAVTVGIDTHPLPSDWQPFSSELPAAIPLPRNTRAALSGDSDLRRAEARPARTSTPAMAAARARAARLPRE